MMTSEIQRKLVVLKIESFLKQEIEKILEKISLMMKYVG